MASQQHRLEKLAEKKTAGKLVKIKVAGVPVYTFGFVRWGGTSPMVGLIAIADGKSHIHTAAEWRKLGVDL